MGRNNIGGVTESTSCMEWKEKGCMEEMLIWVWERASIEAPGVIMVLRFVLLGMFSVGRY